MALQGRRDGSVKRVVRERPGWKGAWGMGDEVPLGGAEGQAASGGGDPWGNGKGDGGAAVFTVESGGSTVPLAFFRGWRPCSTGLRCPPSNHPSCVLASSHIVPRPQQFRLPFHPAVPHHTPSDP